MLFHEPIFLYAFLPATLAAFLVLQSYGATAGAAWLLLMSSMLFYGWWDPRLLPLLAASITFYYLFGLVLVRRAASKSNILLALGIASNLGLLGFFKYADFALSTLNDALGTSAPLLDLPLPLAISFFTFLQIAFLVDCSKQELRSPLFIDYALFVSYFPHLVAGPLVHHSELIPQFRRKICPAETWENLSVGSTIFIIGLAKKTLLASPAGSYSDKLFDAVAAGATPTFIEAWPGVLGFAFQIYFDFSAYSDMAIGISRMFGIWLPVNFASPYKATSIVDFWRRWHITLSRFLRDYLYVPLGGSRRGIGRRYLNLILVMLLGGAWHGAGWTFILWGGLHGLLLAASHAWRDARGRSMTGGHQMSKWIWRPLVFATVVLLWVPFRADSLGTTISIWQGMLGLHGFVLPEHYAQIGRIGSLESLGIRFSAFPLYAGGWQLVDLATACAIVWFCPNTQEIMRNYRPALGTDRTVQHWAPAWRPGLVLAVATGLFACFLFALTLQKKPGEFIYFQF